MSDVIGEAHGRIIVINTPYAIYAIRHILIKLNLLSLNRLYKNIMTYYIAKNIDII